MAEALVAVSISASILQIVDVTAKVTQRINDFCSTTDEMPKALQSIHTQLPFLLETCQNLDTGDESENVLAIIKGCHREIEDLYKTVNKILPGPGDPKLSRAFKALKSIHYQEKFDHALRKIEHFKTDLILHCCQKTSDTPSRAAPGPKVSHNLPTMPMVSSVHRRKLLRELDRKFSDYEYEDGAHKIVVLLGMGGQGKSRLALDFGRRVSVETESTLVLWFDATTKQSMTRAFEDLADRWKSRQRRFTNSDSRITYVNEILAERKWLIIFDNYDHPDEFTDLCTFIPPGDGSILITSRHADAGLLGKLVRMSGMDEGEGLELLRLRTEQNLEEPGNRAAAIQVLHTLGYLPLAIDQAGAYIRQQTLPLPLFLQLYESQREMVLNQKHVYWDYKKKLNGEAKTETSLGVLTTWELSIQQVGSSRITTGVVEHILTIAAFLGHVEISESLFREYAQRTRPLPEWLVCFMTNGDWDPHTYRDVVSKLLRLSLAQGRNSINGECALSLHPVIKDWLQLRISETDRPAVIMEAINILANYIDANIQERSLQEVRSLLGHLDACMSSHRRFPNGTHRLGFGKLRKHAITFSAFYMSHGRYREAEEGFLAVLGHDIQEYGHKHAHTFQTLRQLADAFVHGGKYLQAHDLLSKALLDKKDEVNVELLHTMSALAGVYAKLDRQAEAEKYYEAALKGYSVQKDIAQSREVYQLYERLAEVKRFLGKHTAAESLYMVAHRGYEAECPYDEDATLDMLRTAGGLANLLMTRGRYEEAETAYRKAWQGYKKHLGSDHPKTTVMLTNLAISCRGQGRFEDAESYFEESVKIFQKSLGPDHPDSLRALMNLSICIDKQGQYKEAEVKYREILKGREKKLGLNHTHTRRTIERLAHMLWMQGHHDEAETLVRKILNRIGRPSSEYQVTPTGQGKFPALITLYTEARKRDQCKLALDHVDALETCECLRQIYVEQGDHDKAKEVTEQIQNAKDGKKLKKEEEKPNQGHKSLSPTLTKNYMEGSTQVMIATTSPASLHSLSTRLHTNLPVTRLVIVSTGALLLYIWLHRSMKLPISQSNVQKQELVYAG
ncbi:MAG: hypothetical protein L6R40_003978 [Gallowayella cf. fulva]|nr:MAG: hypothetical protein L6R40_003978 [Xanthomendoza cf. fulva]